MNITELTTKLNNEHDPELAVGLLLRELADVMKTTASDGAARVKLAEQLSDPVVQHDIAHAAMFNTERSLDGHPPLVNFTPASAVHNLQVQEKNMTGGHGVGGSAIPAGDIL